MTWFGRLPLELEAREVMRSIRTALLDRRESDPDLSALPDARFNNLLRQLEVNMDILCLRLRARAPRDPRGRQPACIPRQRRVLRTIQDQFIPRLVQRLSRQARPQYRDHLDDLVTRTFQDWFAALIIVMLRDL